MNKFRITSIILLVIGFAAGYFVYSTELGESDYAFSYGLDLSGGTHMVYTADVSDIPEADVDSSMSSLRDVIERRVNFLGVSEPVVQVERSITGDDAQEHRLIVELPGITDIREAKAIIGETPVLEFKLLKDGIDPFTARAATSSRDQFYTPVGLTGRHLDDSQVQFNQTTGEPYVTLNFNSEGSELFSKLTSENVGRYIAIFLDGDVISQPVVNEAITQGSATISGGFVGPEGLEEARSLVRDLKFGALPVPIEPATTQTIGPELGERVLNQGVVGGAVGIILVLIFLIAWYRLAGLIAGVALVIYIAFMLSIFKLLPVTLTAAGITGFILSIGMAVDANVLIFERMKEELRSGASIKNAVLIGFKRAWLSIRDANLSSILTAIVLFWFGTSLIEGFALVFGLGIVVSMLTAISVTRTFLLAVAPDEESVGREWMAVLFRKK